jgi:CBS domain-containing protein
VVVSDAMVTPMLWIRPQATLREAAETMLTCEVDTLFVLEDGQLVGVIGLRDLFTAPLPADLASRMREERSELHFARTWRSSLIANVMTRNVLTVPSDMPLIRAAALMVNGGKHALPVRQAGVFVGALGRLDVVRALLATYEARGHG